MITEFWRWKLLEQANGSEYLGQQDMRMEVDNTGSRSCEIADSLTSGVWMLEYSTELHHYTERM
jgi:hypothetical protein